MVLKVFDAVESCVIPKLFHKADIVNAKEHNYLINSIIPILINISSIITTQDFTKIINIIQLRIIKCTRKDLNLQPSA